MRGAAAALASDAAPSGATAEPQIAFRRTILGASAFAGVSAVAGGAALIAAPSGDSFTSPTLLDHTPFGSFLVPGLVLTFVVGGLALASAVLTWRRAKGAVDATILSGGALTIWILAEAAMMRSLHALHVIYGALGVLILGLGTHAGLRSGSARHRFIVVVTAGETIGYLFPAACGIVTAHSHVSQLAQTLAVAAAGLFEGAFLGAAQAFALPTRVARFRFAALTSLGAGLVWLGVMAITALASNDNVAPAIKIAAGVAGGIAALAAIGGAQWIELRRHVSGAWRWILWTALAWCIALPCSFAPAPFVDDSTPMLPNAVLWFCGGVCMAYVMAQITWRGAARMRALAEAHP